MYGGRLLMDWVQGALWSCYEQAEGEGGSDET